MLDEVWVDLVDFPNYAVSDCGRVANLTTNAILKGRPTNEGYLRVCLSNDGVVKDVYVHQLVAGAFFDRFTYGEHIEHVNGDLMNNRADNLRLKRVTREHIRAHTREPSRVWGRRVRIIETNEVFLNVRACARYIGGDYSHIYSCLRGERESHKGLTFEYYD